MEDWNALYSDLPSKQQKVAVRNKERVICSEDETRVLQPKELQADLDAVMQSVTLGRWCLQEY
jgi:phosphoacetylglucosamine mutase